MSRPDEPDSFSANGAAEYRYERAPDERPSDAVITALADSTGRPAVPRDASGDPPLSPLYEYLDPDALDAVMAGEDGTEDDRSVTFHYDGYVVTVRTRTVTISPAE